jgi:hypothetical protein
VGTKKNRPVPGQGGRRKIENLRYLRHLTASCPSFGSRTEPFSGNTTNDTRIPGVVQVADHMLIVGSLLDQVFASYNIKSTGRDSREATTITAIAVRRTRQG